MAPEHSGAAIQATRLANGLRSRDILVTFISMCSNREASNVKEHDGFDVIRIFKGDLKSKILAPIRLFLTLFFRRNEIDILHVHGAGYVGNIAVIFARLFNKKTVLKMTMFLEDDAYTIKNKKNNRLNFKIFSSADKLISITPAFVESCRKAQIHESQIVYAPNGVNTDKYNKKKQAIRHQLRHQLGLPSDKKILVYAGIIRPEKGISFLIDVIESLSESRSDFYLLIIGPVEAWLSPEEKQYADTALQRMSDLSKRNLASYLDRQDNLHEFFSTADIFVSATYREGLPNVLLEAMGCGLPSVVISIPNVHDVLFENKIDGIFLEERDASKFAEKIIYLNDNKDLYNEISNHVADKIEHEFSLNSLVGKYEHLYADMLEGKC